MGCNLFLVLSYYLYMLTDFIILNFINPKISTYIDLILKISYKNIINKHIKYSF